MGHQYALAINRIETGVRIGGNVEMVRSTTWDSSGFQYVHVNNAFCFAGMLFCGGRVFFLALSAAGQARRPPVHHDACLDLGRAPWRCSEHSTSLSWLFFQRAAFSLAEPSRSMGKPTILGSLFNNPLAPHILVFASLSRPLYNLISPVVWALSAVCYAAATLV